MLHTNKSDDITKAENERPTASEYAVSFVAVSASLASLFTIECANESVTGESIHEAAVMGARWTPDPGVLPLESSGAKGIGSSERSVFRSRTTRFLSSTVDRFDLPLAWLELVLFCLCRG
jgi:hypothetical protein